MLRPLIFALVLALPACQRRNVDGADSSSVTQPIADVTVIRNPELFTCGEREVTLLDDGDSVVAIVDGTRWALGQRTDSAGQYTASADSGPALQRRGTVMTLSMNGVRLPQCVQRSALPFVARGHEPGWVLRIVDRTITYIGNYGTDTVQAPIVSVSTRNRVTTFMTAPTYRLSANVQDEACADAATGLPHPYRVSVTHGRTTVNGCGGEPSSLLTGLTWTVTDIAGSTVTASPPTLTFMASGRVSGTTSCNRYSAPYRLAGEGLTFGPAMSTKRACAETLMMGEAEFLRLLGRVTRFEIRPDGALALVADDGQAIVARRL